MERNAFQTPGVENQKGQKSEAKSIPWISFAVENDGPKTGAGHDPGTRHRHSNACDQDLKNHHAKRAQSRHFLGKSGENSEKIKTAGHKRDVES